MTSFHWPIRVYYEDTDSGGMVYHANYLRFMERARTEWLRSLGFEQDALRREPGVLFVVHSMDIRFRRPARFNACLNVVSSLLKRRRASLTFDQRIHDENDQAICEATVTVACIDANTELPTALPDALIAEFSHAR
ncbi:acyl-CoA thioester hydrolase [Natronocella acetinitrilica]|uniref:Acyl-CoA thioester hydrolase n=1 Tax=Natronocella acetinitrilica TaxID=414046 RepID=A0AAE3KBU3_9GAMM|nr:tol-pal system-associated acyl-CoA thioesterase [Natronocella acetinitrilica]MCP1674088.1 acyl-CoA thioester hydrolase [Natronocella acetinitrilica]